MVCHLLPYNLMTRAMLFIHFPVAYVINTIYSSIIAIALIIIVIIELANVYVSLIVGLLAYDPVAIFPHA